MVPKLGSLAVLFGSLLFALGAVAAKRQTTINLPTMKVDYTNYGTFTHLDGTQTPITFDGVSFYVGFTGDIESNLDCHNFTVNFMNLETGEPSTSNATCSANSMGEPVTITGTFTGSTGEMFRGSFTLNIVHHPSNLGGYDTISGTMKLE
jgi:hypothetical protein